MTFPTDRDGVYSVCVCVAFQGKITAQGKLLLHGMLTCAERPGGCNTNQRVPHRELHVFLFEQSIIFSEEVGKKTQFTSPVYVYKAHIQVTSLLKYV